MTRDALFRDLRRPGIGFAVILIIAASAAIRFSTLGIQSYWDDEAFTVSLVKLGFWKMLRTIPKTESTPPLYYVLAWVWARMFGTSETALRSLSAVFGTATVPLVYLAAKQLTSRRVALVATALVAINPLFVWYSQEARSYALYAFLCSVSFFFFMCLLREPNSRFLLYWAVASGLALASHYFAIFLVAPEGAWLVLKAGGRRLPAIAALAFVAAVGLALVPLARHQVEKPELAARRAALIHGGSGYHSTGPLGQGASETRLDLRILRIPKAFLVGNDIPAEREVIVVAGFVVLTAIWLLAFRATRQERRAATLAMSIGAAMVGLPIALAVAGKDYVLPYYLIPSIIPFAIAIAIGFAASRIGLALAAAYSLLAFGLLATVDVTPRYQRQNWRGAAQALGPARVERALVVTPSDITSLLTDTPLPLYLPRLRQIHAGSAPVSEVDILGVRVPGSTLPRRPFDFPPPPFRLTARVMDETFTLLRFVTTRPVHVTRMSLLDSHLGDWPPHRITVFTQSPGQEPH